MGCGSSNTSKEPVPVSSDPVQVDDLPISEEILGKIDTATEVHGKIADGMEKGAKFAKKAATFLSEQSDKLDKFGQVFSKASEVIDTVAPWLGPIGIGLKIATSFVSLFVKKGMS